MSQTDLTSYIDAIRQDFTRINDRRDETLRMSRALVRSCANSIRAIHRHEWAEAAAMLAQARQDADAMVAPLADYPALFHAGYTQDALKELVEAHVVYAVAQNRQIPGPGDLAVPGATYLRGLSEAATETRRFVLDLMRRGKVSEAEPYLAFMDEVYSLLVTVDFPDSITDGLRRHTDVLRTVVERTRGDLTLAHRQDEMRAALHNFEARLDSSLGTQLAVSSLNECGEIDENLDDDDATS